MSFSPHRVRRLGPLVHEVQGPLDGPVPHLSRGEVVLESHRLTPWVVIACIWAKYRSSTDTDVQNGRSPLTSSSSKRRRGPNVNPPSLVLRSWMMTPHKVSRTIHSGMGLGLVQEVRDRTLISRMYRYDGPPVSYRLKHTLV